MRIIKAISIFIILFGCNSKVHKTPSEFSEQDAYQIINMYVQAELLLNNEDSLIYWNNRQLKSPEFEHTLFGSGKILNLTEIPAPFPVFTSEYWKMDKIKGVKEMDWKDYNSFFKKNDSVDLETLWDSLYSGEYVHNVSYPIYNSKTKIAVIKDYRYRPFLQCGTGLDKMYYFRKTEMGWIELE